MQKMMHLMNFRTWLALVCLSVVVLVTTGTAAAALVAGNDTYAVPRDQFLESEAPGVLGNDTLDNNPAEDSNVTVELLADSSFGDLVLNTDGSFTYTPGPDFPGMDSFTYQAAFDTETSQATVTLTACSGGPSLFTCWKEAPYLAKLSDLGYSTFQEGFENDAVWGSFREPVAAESVASMGIIWASNHPNEPSNNTITTGDGPARTGGWGVYDPDHGYAIGNPAECDVDIPPEQCLYKDGFTGTRESGQSVLHGVGGFFQGSSQPNLSLILDGTTHIAIGPLTLSGSHFFGVIDTSGFDTFKVLENDGKIGQARLVFGDDFTFALAGSDAMPPRVAEIFTPDGVLAEGASTSESVTLLAVDFNELVREHTLDTPADNVENPGNYLLFSDNGDGFDTIDCAGGIDAGDNPTTIDAVTYVSGSERTATLDINGGQPLPAGSYRLLVCGTTSIRDWAGNPLDGNGDGSGGDDFARNFSITVAPINNPPVAEAGTAQSVVVGDTVALDGSASSDVDGDTLTYAWSFTSRPAGSTAALDFTDPVRPTFDVDLPGSYVVQLVVNDGTINSTPDTVTVTTGNSAPVAEAGTAQSVLVGDNVALDGSASNDADGDTLTYTWSFSSRPAGSSVSLDTTDPVRPFFDVDLPGSYVIQLVVNDGSVNSTPDTVTVTTDNSTPVAEAGNAQSVLVGDTVTLDGNGSNDADGDALTYNWSFSSKPAGSNATLDTTDPALSTFVVDVTGSYVIQLVVNDGSTSSTPDTVGITAYAPVTVTNGPAQGEEVIIASGETSQTYTVQGGGGIAYAWAVTDPDNVQIDTHNGSSYAFTAPSTGTFAGAYTITVQDNHGFQDSFQVKVLLGVSPHSRTFTETNLDNTPNPQEFEASGTAATLVWDILAAADDVTAVPTPAEYGTWDNISPVNGDVTNTFNPADVNTVTVFYIRVTVLNDPALTDQNGLNRMVVGPFTLVPVDSYVVTVTDMLGTPIADALVNVDYAGQLSKVTDAQGYTDFLLPDAGGTYQYTVSADGYVNNDISSSQKLIIVQLDDVGLSFSGTVEDKGGQPLAGVVVKALQPGNIADTYTAMSNPDGSYKIDLPINGPGSGFTVVAVKPDYVSAAQSNQTPGVLDFTGVYGLQAKTTLISIDVAVAGGETILTITANPAFSSSAEVGLTLADGTGMMGLPTLSNETIEATYSATDSFTVIIKADTSEDRDPGSGYAASYAVRIAAGESAGADQVVDVDAGGGTGSLMANGQAMNFQVPAGGFTKPATVYIRQVPKTANTMATEGSLDYVYELTAFDSSTGTPLAPTDIIGFEIGLPMNLGLVQPDDLENGFYIVYKANDLNALESGKGTPLPAANIIATDYVGDGTLGKVTIFATHFSFFGIGTTAIVDPPTDGGSGNGGGSNGGGGGGGCFIASAGPMPDQAPGAISPNQAALGYWSLISIFLVAIGRLLFKHL